MLVPSPRSSRQSDGYALILVLLGIALLSLILEIVLLDTTQSVHAASTEAAQLRLQCAAEAGISEAILSLHDPWPGRRWPVDGTPRLVEFGGVAVTVSVTSESGKIDLNNANRSLVFGLFTAAGLDQTDANTLTDRVLDWREKGNFKRLNGAKAPDYQAAGLSYGPRDGPFQSIDELKLVLGMTPQLYGLLEPGITVYSVLPEPIPQDAPPIVLRATGISLPGITTIMATRAQGNVAPAGFAYGPNVAAPVPGLPGAVFTIEASARDGDFTVVRNTIIRFTGDPNDPFWVLR